MKHVVIDNVDEDISKPLQDDKEQIAHRESATIVMENTGDEIQNKALGEIIVCAYRKSHSLNHDQRVNESMLPFSDEYAPKHKDLSYSANREDRRPHKLLPNMHTTLPVGEVMEYEPGSRSSFLQLVFCLVFWMMAVTAGFNILVMMIPVLTSIFSSPWCSIVPGMIINLVVSIGFMCYNNVRVPPCNIIFLILSVIGMSLTTVYFTSRYKTEIVAAAVVATAVVVLICFLLACSSFDFTKYILYLILASVAVLALLVIVLLFHLFTKIKLTPVFLVILFVSTIVQALIFTMEIQMVLGGKTIELGVDDYAYGAFMLYTSIIDIFIKLLMMFDIIENMT